MSVLHHGLERVLLLAGAAGGAFELRLGWSREAGRAVERQEAREGFIAAMTAEVGDSARKGFASLDSAKVQAARNEAMGGWLAGAVVVRVTGAACSIVEHRQLRLARCAEIRIALVGVT